MSLKGFFDAILENKRNAEGLGWKLDLIILPLKFQETVFAAVVKEAYAGDAYSLGTEKEGYPVRLYGVKVLWSGSRLPENQAWYRYSSRAAGKTDNEPTVRSATSNVHKGGR